MTDVIGSASDRSDTETPPDIIIIGAGGSGLTAAIVAAEQGQKVLVLEKNPDIGGSTIRSIGSISATRTRHQLQKGIEDSPDEHFEDFTTINDAIKATRWKDFDNEDNEVLRRILVENVADSVRWLESIGVRFYGPTLEPPHKKPRMHNVMPNSRAYGYWLAKRARSLGIKILTNRRARQFLMDGRRVTGVECETGDGRSERHMARGAVILSCGDFSAGKDMKRKFARAELVEMQTSCNPANTGDGHLMALRLGAKIINAHMAFARIRFVAPPLDSLVHRLPPWRGITWFMGKSLTYIPDWLLRPFIMSFLTTVLEAQPSLFKHGAILVNRKGERFCDERVQPEFQLVRQPDQLAYMIFDDRLARKYSTFPHFVSTAPGVAYAFIPDYRRNRRDIFRKAASLDALALSFAADPAMLRKSVEDRNGELARARNTGEADEAFTIEQAPFYTLGPLSCFVPGTEGGLAIDGEFRILGENQQPIPGLFGAGIVAQGGVMLEGHGHHLGWAFTSGRLAGRNAALYSIQQHSIQQQL